MENRSKKPLYDQDAPSGVGAQGSRRQAGPGYNPEKMVGRNPLQGKPPQGRSAMVHTSKRTAERKRKKKRRQRIALISVSLVVLLLATAVVWGAVSLANQISGRNDPRGAGILPEEVKTQAIPEYTGKGIITALICGIDYNNENADGYLDESNKIGNTDLILYMMYDTEKNKVNILQIPRDTYMGEEVNTGGTGKINGLFRYADDEKNRIAPLAKAVKDQLGLPIDFYATLDMDAVKAIVDHMGFIQVYLPHNIVDPETGATVLGEGWTNLTADEVEAMVRNRNYADADISRLRTQQSLYSALFREFKKLAPGDLVMWMRILTHYLKVDGISLMQLGGLAQKALSISAADVTFVRPPYSGAWYTPKSGILEGKRQAMMCFVPDETADMLNQYFRPDGHTLTVDDLNINTLPVNEYGQGPAEVKTMTSIQEVETPIPPPW